jgi:hypothetical protein
MVVAIFYILYAGITKAYGLWLNISLGLLILESVVYLGNGRKCPFTDLAVKHGDKKGYVGDIFMPKKVADNTFYFFGGLFVLGLLILLFNYLVR